MGTLSSSDGCEKNGIICQQQRQEQRQEEQRCCQVLSSDTMATTGSSRVMDLARSFNNAFLSLRERLLVGEVVEVWLGEVRVGFMRKSVFNKIKEFEKKNSDSDHRVMVEDNGGVVVRFGVGVVGIGDIEKRSGVVEEFLRGLRETGDDDAFVTLRGWRGERFEVKERGGYPGDGSGVLLEMERSATCIFGMRQYGVDINGFVRDPERGLCLWVQKRAHDKQTWPGKMDNMVGGGLSVGYTVLETALKEASEEAGIPSSLLLSRLVPAGTVSFFFESERGLFPNTEFVFDLELPTDFVPNNVDGEVEGFQLITAEEALELVLSPEFKTTSCPVTLDFLVRHGVINPMNESGYATLLEYLHVPLSSIFNDTNKRSLI